MILDCGENTEGVVFDCGGGVDTHAARDIDPDDFSNIEVLLAFDWTQAAPQSS